MVESFGEHFLNFAINNGYDRLLKVLGGSLYDVLSDLDQFHTHLSSIFPNMHSPSFRCKHTEDGGLILHYYSERNGYEYFVVGLIKALAKQYFDTIVRITLAARKGKKSDHTILIIKEEALSNVVIRKRSSSLVSQLGKVRHSTNPRDLAFGIKTFCKTFPFHMVLDRKLHIVQIGSSLFRVLKPCYKATKKMKFSNLFEILRPVVNEDFESILDNLTTVFNVRSKPGVVLPLINTQSSDMLAPQAVTRGRRESFAVIFNTDRKEVGLLNNDTGPVMRLKGQMVFIPESDNILFLCSPRVADIDDLKQRGIYLSDIPLHDPTRDLILISQVKAYFLFHKFHQSLSPLYMLLVMAFH